MNESLTITQFLGKSAANPVIDVRSPSEYHHGHIPGAVNIPLFDDAERARIGTTYKQKGPDPALLEGLDIVGPKMSSLVRQARKIAGSGSVLVHCWRGGMRSASFAWLIRTAGIPAGLLQGGYKAYRNHVLASFSTPLRLKIVGGETGSGKTDIIRQIAAAGEQVIDLEALARHRGSAFGALGQQMQPTVEQFENDLCAAFSQIDQERTVWLEDESRSIGRVYIPGPLWEQMEKAPIYRIRLSQEIRLKRLLAEYGQFTLAELETAVLKIKKRLGDKTTREAIAALREGRLEETARLSLAYYDKAYNHPLARKKSEAVFNCESDADDPAANAAAILKLAAGNTPLIID